VRDRLVDDEAKPQDTPKKSVLTAPSVVSDCNLCSQEWHDPCSNKGIVLVPKNEKAATEGRKTIINEEERNLVKSSSVLKGFVLAMITVVFLFQGCKGPAGPQGPPGETTVINLEGFAADIKCGKCHTADQDTTYFVAGRVYEWSQSKHAVGGDLERNGSGCAGCHTTEGFVQRMNAGSFSAVTNQFHPSPPGCFACHSPHARGDFSLRIKTPVVIKSNITGVSDATFDYGKGNLCVQCHQTRDMSPKMNASAPGDSIAITTSRWYSHYGVQGQMLMGEGGFKFPGYTYTGNSYHTTSTTIKQVGCPT